MSDGIGDAITTADDASVRIDQLKADPQFMDRIKAGDPAAFAKHTKLWRIQHGMTPTPQPPQHSGDVMEQMQGRALHLAEQLQEQLLDTGIGPEGVYQYMNSRPIPLAEKEFHEREIRRLKSDPEWVKKYLAGNLEARDTMRRHTVGSVMRTGTIDEIRQWEIAHYGKAIS